jgi:uncharacterized protein (UPF0333 family)
MKRFRYQRGQVNLLYWALVILVVVVIVVVVTGHV